MIYAIDFGTTNSLLGAASANGIHDPIPLDPHGGDPTILRSVLFFPDRYKCHYGAQAIREYVKHDMEGRFIRSIKKFLPMRSFVSTQVDGRTLSLEEIIATFLGEMRRRANAHFEKDVDSVLLGRPAKFSQDEAEDALAESRLRKAAEIAGFKHISFCPEPIAAAHEFKATLTETKTVLVGDFGGGTSDFTVVRIGREKFRKEDVLSLGGVSLAGDALDGAIMRGRIAANFGSEVKYQAPFGANVLTMPRNLMEKICSPADISLLRERDTMEFFRNVQNWSLGDGDRKKIDQLFSLIHEQFGFELFEEIERVKKGLSQKPQELFRFDYPGIEILETLTLQDFRELAESTVERIVESLDETVKNAGIKYADVDLVCATGGTAKVPAIQNALETRFGKEKVREGKHFHSIVQGLAKAAGDLL